jgi:hypothetical protein
VAREFLPPRVEVRHYRLGELFVFRADAIPGLYVASKDLRQAFELLAPVASEIMRRATGIGVQYHLDETLIGFQTRMTLLNALREGSTPIQSSSDITESAPPKYHSQRRLVRALLAIDALELGKQDRHATYWRARSGVIFSVMGPTTRTQSGKLLYSEVYIRDLIGMVQSMALPHKDDARRMVGQMADLVLRLERV